MLFALSYFQYLRVCICGSARRPHFVEGRQHFFDDVRLGPRKQPPPFTCAIIDNTVNACANVILFMPQCRLCGGLLGPSPASPRRPVLVISPHHISWQFHPYGYALRAGKQYKPPRSLGGCAIPFQVVTDFCYPYSYPNGGEYFVVRSAELCRFTLIPTTF